MESKEEFLYGGISNFGGGDENRLDQVNGENGLGGDEMVKRSSADEVLVDFGGVDDDGDGLTISRMVTAVEEEKIRIKDVQVVECLQSRGIGRDTCEPMRLPMEPKAREVGDIGMVLSSDDVLLEHDKMREELHALGNAVREQFEKFEKEINCAKSSSDWELVGFGGVLLEKERSLHLDKMLESLKSTVDAVCIKADHVSLSSKVFLHERQQEQDLLGKFEDMVMQSLLKSLQEEFTQCHRVHNVNSLEKLNDLSGLRTELDSVLKSLSISEIGLVSHGSQDLDRLHHGTLSSHVSQIASVSEESGILDASVSHVPKSYDFQQLKHMSREELVCFFNNIISNMRRDQESALHKMTEKYFCLKREYLKERGSSVTHTKSEEFDLLRKKIPGVIMKLDKFLLECQIFPTLPNDIDSPGALKDKLECILSENRELRDCLTDRNNEIKCLEAQLSSAAEKSLMNSLAEENMRNVVADLKSALDISHVEAYLSEEIYKCALKELIGLIKCNSEESYVKFHMMREIQEIILKAATIPSETRAVQIEDYDFQSLIVEELSGLILREVIKDAEGKLNHLHREILIEKENRICLETTVLQKENELRLEVEEKERLKQDILVLGAAVEQKDKLAEDLSTSLFKERAQLELAFRELSSLRENLSQQQILVAESNSNFELLSVQLLEASQQIEDHQTESHKLYEKLDQTKELLIEANREKDIAYALAKERLDKLLTTEARAEELNKEVELAIDSIHGLSKIFDNFECRISGAITNNNLRLEETTSHLNWLTKVASVLRQKELMYKQKLEWRYADLQMAESEEIEHVQIRKNLTHFFSIHLPQVDLLGDEVDALLSLLEKIYIALDHYSPILKHYPGIIEILELVRRELRGASMKLSQSNPWQG